MVFRCCVFFLELPVQVMCEKKRGAGVAHVCVCVFSTFALSFFLFVCVTVFRAGLRPGLWSVHVCLCLFACLPACLPVCVCVRACVCAISALFSAVCVS